MARVVDLPTSGPVQGDEEFFFLQNGHLRRGQASDFTAAATAQALAARDDVLDHVATVEALSGPIVDTPAEGESLTTAGQGFQVDGPNGLEPYLRTDSGSKPLAPLATRANLAAPDEGMGADIVARSGPGVPTKDALARLPFSVQSYAVLNDPERGGIFEWVAGDFSSKCAIDTLRGIWIAPEGQDGSGGAWRRLMDGAAVPQWFDNTFGDGSGDVAPAFNIAASLGHSIQGREGSIYRINSDVLRDDGLDLIIRMHGCSIVRGSGADDEMPAIDFRPPVSATTYSSATDILNYELVPYNYGNGAIKVPCLTVADASAFAVGQFVKLLSDTVIPSVAPWHDMRYADMGEIGHIDLATNQIYLIRPFAEDVWEPKKLVAFSTAKLLIEGGVWTDEAGSPQSRRAPMINAVCAIRPHADRAILDDTLASQIAWKSCYEPRDTHCQFLRARFDPSVQAYGYGVKCTGGCVRPVSINAFIVSCRHGFDTGGDSIATSSLPGTHPYIFGGVIDAQVFHAVGFDCMNAPVCDHPDAFRSRFYHCTSIWTNRRTPNATLWGILLRGRQSGFVGGRFDGITPVKIEPSTTAPMVCSGGECIKHMVDGDEAARDAMVIIDGRGIVGGGQGRVLWDGDPFLSQKGGKKELVWLANAVLEFDGRAKYDATEGNAVVFAVGEDAEVLLHGIKADFANSTAATPMLAAMQNDSARLTAPGRVYMTNSPAVNSTIVLCSFEGNAASARLDDVIADGPLFGGDGWRNEENASLMRAIFRRHDTDDGRPNDIQVNFGQSPGAKAISWNKGCGEEQIFVEVNCTWPGTWLGTIPDGLFNGQRALLHNSGNQTFEVNSSPANVGVLGDATRTIEPGGLVMLRWDEGGLIWRA